MPTITYRADRQFVQNYNLSSETIFKLAIVGLIGKPGNSCVLKQNFQDVLSAYRAGSLDLDDVAQVIPLCAIDSEAWRQPLMEMLHIVEGVTVAPRVSDVQHKPDILRNIRNAGRVLIASQHPAYCEDVKKSLYHYHARADIGLREYILSVRRSEGAACDQAILNILSYFHTAYTAH